MTVCSGGHLQQAGGHNLGFREGRRGSLTSRGWLPSVLQKVLVPASYSTATRVPGGWRGMEPPVTNWIQILGSGKTKLCSTAP